MNEDELNVLKKDCLFRVQCFKHARLWISEKGVRELALSRIAKVWTSGRPAGAHQRVLKPNLCG